VITDNNFFLNKSNFDINNLEIIFRRLLRKSYKSRMKKHSSFFFEGEKTFKLKIILHVKTIFLINMVKKTWNKILIILKH